MNCSSCAFYSAIDPSAGNCRAKGSTRDAITGTTPAASCSRHLLVANDDARVAPKAA